jgi:hypothetical protein
MMKRKKPEASEHEIQSAILDYLKLKGVFAYRNNVGAVKIGKRFIRFGMPGAPDIVAVVSGHYFGIEVKRPGNTLSEDQVAFCGVLRQAGGTYLVCQSLLDLTSWFEGAPEVCPSLDAPHTKPHAD